MDIQEKILTGAVSLFFRYGTKSVSMDDIAKNLGISKKTIYNFIENKKDLVHRVIVNYVNKDEIALKKIISSSEDALNEMIALSKHVESLLNAMKPTLIYDLQKYHRETWAFITTKHFEFIHNVIKNNILRGIKEGFYRAEVDAEVIARFYSKTSEVCTDDRVFSITEYPKAQLFLIHLDYHMNAIVNENGRQILETYNLKYTQ